MVDGGTADRRGNPDAGSDAPSGVYPAIAKATAIVVTTASDAATGLPGI